MPKLRTDTPEYDVLEKRVGRLHLRQRLGIETDHETQIFGQGLNFFHIENWYSIHSIIRLVLRLTGLHERGRRNALDVRVRHNSIGIEGLPGSFDGFTILHLSDLHVDMNPDTPQAIIDCVDSLEYDICVLTGDFRALTYGSNDSTVAGMRTICSRLRQPVYAVLGNHDSIRMVPALEDMGIRMLMNESVIIERGDASIHLAGIDDPHYFRADNLEKAYQDIPAEAVSVLLSHSPEIYQHAAHAGFDVMLCGHTHGGQICLPGGTPLMCNARCPRELCAGAWRYQGMAGYTSAGAGTSIVDVRLNCLPEATLHRLRPTQAG